MKIAIIKNFKNYGLQLEGKVTKTFDADEGVLNVTVGETIQLNYEEKFFYNYDYPKADFEFKISKNLKELRDVSLMVFDKGQVYLFPKGNLYLLGFESNGLGGFKYHYKFFAEISLKCVAITANKKRYVSLPGNAYEVIATTY